MNAPLDLRSRELWERARCWGGGRSNARLLLRVLVEAGGEALELLQEVGLDPAQVAALPPSELAWDRCPQESRVELWLDEEARVAWTCLRGCLDGQQGEEIRRLADRAFEADCPRLVVDLAGVSYVESCALGRLVHTADQAQERGGELLLIHVPPKVRLVIEMLGLEVFLTLLADEAEALERLGHPRCGGLTPELRQALAVARELATRAGRPLCSPGHLLVGLAAACPGLAGLCAQAGITPLGLRQALVRVRERPVPEPSTSAEEQANLRGELHGLRARLAAAERERRRLHQEVARQEERLRRGRWWLALAAGGGLAACLLS